MVKVMFCKMAGCKCTFHKMPIYKFLALQLDLNNRTWWEDNHPDHKLPSGEGSRTEAYTGTFVLNGEWQLLGKGYRNH